MRTAVASSAAPTASISSMDDRAVRITRIFDAPREQVFRAWIDPDEVAAWYGPAHMQVARERVRIDACVGGRWEVTMVPRGGGEGFAIGYEILELVVPELLIVRSDPMPEATPKARSCACSCTTMAPRPG